MRTCNHCNKEMKSNVDTGERYVSICLNEKCKAFGLLQIDKETINKFNIKK